eukprot:8459534-Pyramimonas_sp.AAC.1
MGSGQESEAGRGGHRRLADDQRAQKFYLQRSVLQPIFPPLDALWRRRVCAAPEYVGDGVNGAAAVAGCPAPVAPDIHNRGDIGAGQRILEERLGRARARERGQPSGGETHPEFP